MKIDRPVDSSSAVQATGMPAADAAKAKAAAGHAAAGSDASAEVKLSNTAETLLAGGTSAEFDADKVKQMSEAIANGSFVVNPDAIADKLIANAQELLAKVKG